MAQGSKKMFQLRTLFLKSETKEEVLKAIKIPFLHELRIGVAVTDELLDYVIANFKNLKIFSCDTTKLTPEGLTKMSKFSA
jgi:hypothetical protein